MAGGKLRWLLSTGRLLQVWEFSWSWSWVNTQQAQCKQHAEYKSIHTADEYSWTSWLKEENLRQVLEEVKEDIDAVNHIKREEKQAQLLIQQGLDLLGWGSYTSILPKPQHNKQSHGLSLIYEVEHLCSWTTKLWCVFWLRLPTKMCYQWQVQLPW